MKLNTTPMHIPYKNPNTGRTTANQTSNSATASAQNPFAWEPEETLFDIFDIFDFTGDETQPHLNAFLAQNEEASGVASGQNSSPEDQSGNLTRRLVSANNTFIIHRIIGDAFKNLGELRLALAMSDGDEADAKRQIIRRLERVIRRGNRKIRELTDEARMQQRQERAERDDQAQRAREIEDELRRQIQRRRQRERGYLEELTREEMQRLSQDMLDSATEAAIAAKAQQLAAAQVAAAGASSSGGFDMPGGMPFGGGPYMDASAGGVGGYVAASGELDVSV